MLLVPLLLATSATASRAPSPAPEDGYRLPPPEIVEVLDAEPTPDVQISPDGLWMLLVERPAMPSIDEVARPWVGLAGDRIDVQLSMPQQTSFATGITFEVVETGAQERVLLAEGARIGAVSWSPRGTRFVFTLATDEGTELWACDVRDRRPRRVARGLNGVLGDPFTWCADGDTLIVKLNALERETLPKRPGVPPGPATQDTTGAKTALRTYQDLLRDPADVRLFEWLATTRLAWIRLSPSDSATAQARRPEAFGPGGLYVSAEPSTDGQHVLVTRLERPFSYVLPWSLFPRTLEVWSARGDLERKVADVPLGDAIPMEGVRTGPRDVQWAASEAATLVWVEAQDGGDPAREAEVRDRWFRQPAPFTAAAEPFLTLEQRARGLRFLADPNLVLASEYDRDRRWVRARIFDRSKAGGAPIVVEDRNRNDRYGDRGNFASTIGPFGTRILRQDGEFLYRVGLGATREGARPFLDRWSLVTQQSERLWRCGEGAYESVVAFLSSSAVAKPVIVTVHESPDSPPNWRVRDLEQGTVRPLTSFGDPQPRLRGVSQELIRYKRQDGVELSGRLYLPPGYQAGTRLPAFVWAYPLEYSDAGTAGQLGSSPNRFVRVRGPSPVLFALHGYAVLDEAAMPVVGDPETVNDTFLQQIAWNAEAAVAELERRGVADPDRVGVGGHSYGAFMTANLLAHTDVFRAGIARSGAYNRTLTPFGFQSERRTLWEAPKAYLELSPFLAANRIDEPLLLIHGEKDDNTGTFPIQSERLFQAIQGNGGTARLVFLPEEAHGYRARESVLHCVAEMFDWMDRWVRDAAPREPRAVPAASEGESGGR